MNDETELKPEYEFDVDQIELGEHSFTLQRGNFLECTVPGHKHAVNIGPGRELIKNERGEFELIRHQV